MAGMWSQGHHNQSIADNSRFIRCKMKNLERKKHNVHAEPWLAIRSFGNGGRVNSCDKYTTYMSMTDGVLHVIFFNKS